MTVWEPVFRNVYSLHPAHINLSEGFLKIICFNLLSKSIYLVVTQQTWLLVSVTILAPLLINRKLIQQICQLTQ